MARTHGGLDEAREITREAVHLWEALVRLSYIQSRLDAVDMVLGSLTVRPPSGDGGDWLLVCRMSVEGRPHVGFISGHDVATCFRSLVSKLENGSMKWKVDEYAGKERS